ncbi:hypothetical protein PENSPDRAFT_685804 [Peniophora sp. CONT]|nr:hypothetical protein PENSPDRAFT_685804 [Peniophora sp. CONT]
MPPRGAKSSYLSDEDCPQCHIRKVLRPVYCTGHFTPQNTGRQYVRCEGNDLQEPDQSKRACIYFHWLPEAPTSNSMAGTGTGPDRTTGPSTSSTGGKKCAVTTCTSKRPHRSCGLCRKCCEKRQQDSSGRYICDGHGALATLESRANPTIPHSVNDRGERTPSIISPPPPQLLSPSPTQPVLRTDFAKNISPVYRELLAYNEVAAQAGHRETARQAAYERAVKKEFKIFWYTENYKAPLPFEGLPLPERHLFHPSDFPVIVDIVGAKNCSTSFWHYNAPDKRWAVRMGPLSARANDIFYMRSMGVSDDGCLEEFPVELLAPQNAQRPSYSSSSLLPEQSLGRRVASVSSASGKKRALSISSTESSHPPGRTNNHSPTKQVRRWDTSSFYQSRSRTTSYQLSRSTSPELLVAADDFFDLSSDPEDERYPSSPPISRPPSSAASFRTSSPEPLTEGNIPDAHIDGSPSPDLPYNSLQFRGSSASQLSGLIRQRQDSKSPAAVSSSQVAHGTKESFVDAPPGRFPFRYSCDMDRFLRAIEEHQTLQKTTQKAAFSAILKCPDSDFKPSTFSEHYGAYRSARNDNDGAQSLRESIGKGRVEGGEWDIIRKRFLKPKTRNKAKKSAVP